MSKKPKTEPAFPTTIDNRPVAFGSEGLSMRDYFAAKAMQACIAKGAPLIFIDIACKAYEMADAMLCAREGTYD
jgi:hypothetical protein